MKITDLLDRFFGSTNLLMNPTNVGFGSSLFIYETSIREKTYSVYIGIEQQVSTNKASETVLLGFKGLRTPNADFEKILQSLGLSEKSFTIKRINNTDFICAQDSKSSKLLLNYFLKLLEKEIRAIDTHLSIAFPGFESKSDRATRLERAENLVILRSHLMKRALLDGDTTLCDHIFEKLKNSSLTPEIRNSLPLDLQEDLKRVLPNDLDTKYQQRFSEHKIALVKVIEAIKSHATYNQLKYRERYNKIIDFIESNLKNIGIKDNTIPISAIKTKEYKNICNAILTDLQDMQSVSTHVRNAFFGKPAHPDTNTVEHLVKITFQLLNAPLTENQTTPSHRL